MVPTGKHKPELMKLVGEVLSDLNGRPLDAEMESRLNERFGPHTVTYQRLSQLLRAGVEEGWAAYVDIEGSAYRRGRLAEPSADTAQMSIESGLLQDVKGQYHCHTLGEINMIIPLEREGRFCGHGAGWKVFPPMSEHFPTVTGRALMMYFLPEGKIEYKAPPAEIAA
jgi:2-hydroxylaminobenzoate mutase